MGKLFFLFKITFFVVAIAVFLQTDMGTDVKRALKMDRDGPVSRTIQKFGMKIRSFTKRQYEGLDSRIDSFLKEKSDEFQKNLNKRNPETDTRL